MSTNGTEPSTCLAIMRGNRIETSKAEKELAPNLAAAAKDLVTALETDGATIAGCADKIAALKTAASL